MKEATQLAIDLCRNMVGYERDYKTLVLGSLHGINFKYDTKIDWTDRGIEGNVNFMFDEINAGDWNLVFNCCCEHMYPMSEITLQGIYVLQSNNRYSDYHLNRHLNLDSFLSQINLKDVHYSTTDIIGHNGVEYYTVIGEK